MNALESTARLVSFEVQEIAGLRVEHSRPVMLGQCTLPIVFVHGMWCNGAMMMDVMRQHSMRGYECYAPTLPFHGTDVLNNQCSVKDYVEAISNFLKIVGREVILVGHSMGALIGARVAHKLPGIVRAFIAITSAPPIGVMMGMKAFGRLPRYMGKMFRSEAFHLSYDDARNLLFNRQDDRTAVQLAKSLCRESGKAALDITRGVWIHKLKQPCLVIAGTHDNITPRQKAVARRLGADFQTVKMGHMFMFDENMAAVTLTIDAWLHQRIPAEHYKAA